jgi:hypothetical protein
VFLIRDPRSRCQAALRLGVPADEVHRVSRAAAPLGGARPGPQGGVEDVAHPVHEERPTCLVGVAPRHHRAEQLRLALCPATHRLAVLDSTSLHAALSAPRTKWNGVETGASGG